MLHVDYSELMNLSKHRIIFEIIAPVYNWFFQNQKAHYGEILARNETCLGVASGAQILDIGCGTGALTAAFSERGYRVTGVDLSRAMVRYGNKKGLSCTYGNAVEGLHFPDNSFDLVVCAFVAHGLGRLQRSLLYLEAARLSKGPVLIHDYGPKKSLGTTCIEFLEGGGYFTFIKTGIREMKTVFSHVQVVPVDAGAYWYICSS